jgi:hypothetical protein
VSAESAEVARVDAVLVARIDSAAEYIAGLIADAMLDTAGSVSKLPQDEFPDYPPEMVAEVAQRFLVVGMRAERLRGSPHLNRDKLARLQRELDEAGFVAMGGRSRAVLSGPARYPELHAIDDEEARGH